MRIEHVAVYVNHLEKEMDESACIHRLMALEGAIQGVKKTMLTDEVKADLKEFYQRHPVWRT